MTHRLNDDTGRSVAFETYGLRVAAYPHGGADSRSGVNGTGGWNDAIPPDHLYLLVNLSNAAFAVTGGGGDIEIGRASPRMASFLPLASQAGFVGAVSDGPVLRITASRRFLHGHPSLCRALVAASARLHFPDPTLLGVASRLHEHLTDTGVGQADPSGRVHYVDSADEITAYAVIVLSCLAARLRDDGQLSRDGWPARVRSAVEFIEARLDQDLPLPDIAASAGVSQYHFARLFRRAVGTSVHQYVVARRVERAAHLLETTDVPLVEVAHEAGFGSQSHMTSVMRKTLDRTPGDLRGIARGNGTDDRASYQASATG